MFVFELICGVYYFAKFKTLASAPTLSRMILGNNWNPKASKKCSYAETLGPHPYLGYSIHAKARENCDLYTYALNNRGMSGPDYPVEKDDEFFTILLTGGSVADQLGAVEDPNSGHFLTNYFNKNFISPNGKPFRVIISALGDYRFPQNVISVMINNDIIDGVIDISGFNESHNHQFYNRLERPSANYWSQFELETADFKKSNNKKVFELSKWMGNSLCKYSYGCVFIIEKRISQLMNAPKSEARHMAQKPYSDFTNEVPKNLKISRYNKHRNYYRILTGMCRELKFKCAFFLQPVPQLYKSLSPAEELIVRKENPNFGEVYAELLKELLVLQNENIPLYSLAKVFEDERRTIYSDHIHYQWAEGEEIHYGYKPILREIGKVLVKQWNLKKK
jgi:hypothetical protein